MEYICCFVAEVVAMVYCRNWSWDGLGFASWLDQALVLPQSPTSQDQFPSHYKAYKLGFWQDFCFKYRSNLSCCCNILDGATIGTSFNNWISYCWRHVWRSHCLGRSLFTIIASSLNNGSVSHAHASNNSKSYCSMTQQSAHVKFSLDFHSKQKNSTKTFL